MKHGHRKKRPLARHRAALEGLHGRGEGAAPTPSPCVSPTASLEVGATHGSGTMRPDPGIVRELRKIERGLYVEWCSTPGAWGIFWSEQLDARPEDTIEKIADALQLQAALLGHILDKTECQMAAAQAFRDSYLVCYVVEEDGPRKGQYRPLDQRIVTKMQRMDYYRRNCGLSDWKEMLSAKARMARDARLRQENDVWEVIRRDKVFARQVGDILWGMKPARSVLVPSNYDSRTMGSVAVA